MSLLKYLLSMVTPDPVYGKCYVMPLNKESAYAQFHGDYYFFLGCFDGGKTYSAIDTYMGAGAMNFGSFKYYSRVSQLGELALLTERGTVYAIEKKPEAVKLMYANRRRFHAGNMEIIEGE